MKRRIAAILAADVAGFSRLVSEDEEETLRRLASYRQVFDGFVDRYGGRIFNTAGDSAMCCFDSAVEAVRAAIDIQEALKTRNLSYPPSRRLEFRIGITIGDVVDQGGDLLGEGVNIAARLEGLSEPGGICVSRSVHEAVVNKISVPFRDIGARTLKNIPQPVQAFVVAWPGSEVYVEPLGDDRRPTAQSRAERRAARDRERDEKHAARDREREARRGEREREIDDEPPSRRWRYVLIPIVVLAMIFVVVPFFKNLKHGIQRLPELGKETTERPSPTGSPADVYAALAKSGLLVASPRMAAEHFHNARIFEARGDVRNARRAFLEFAALKSDFLDAHLRLAAFIKAQEGPRAARELYAKLAAEQPSKTVMLVEVLQHDGAERRAKLETFMAENPDYPAASWFLAEERSAARRGTQTLTDRRQEFEALERFLEHDDILVPLFLDRTVLAQWIETGRSRKAAIEEFFKTAATRPVASFSRAAESWKVAVTLPEPATAVAFKIGEASAFQPAAMIGGADGNPGTGASLELPAAQDKAVLHVTYKDVSGEDVGPFDINFDPLAALAENQRKVLVASPTLWIEYKKRDKGFIFPHLVAHRCAIKKVSVGFDGGPVDNNLRLPPCDPSQPFTVPKDADTYVPIADPKVEIVVVRLTFMDDSESEARSFPRE